MTQRASRSAVRGVGDLTAVLTECHPVGEPTERGDDEVGVASGLVEGRHRARILLRPAPLEQVLDLPPPDAAIHATLRAIRFAPSTSSGNVRHRQTTHAHDMRARFCPASARAGALKMRPRSRTLGGLVDEMATARPDADAVVFRGERLTFAALRDQSRPAGARAPVAGRAEGRPGRDPAPEPSGVGDLGGGRGQDRRRNRGYQQLLDATGDRVDARACAPERHRHDGNVPWTRLPGRHSRRAIPELVAR